MKHSTRHLYKLQPFLVALPADGHILLVSNLYRFADVGRHAIQKPHIERRLLVAELADGLQFIDGITEFQQHLAALEQLIAEVRLQSEADDWYVQVVSDVAQPMDIGPGEELCLVHYYRMHLIPLVDGFDLFINGVGNILAYQFETDPRSDPFMTAPCIYRGGVGQALLALGRILVVCSDDLVAFVALHRSVSII